MFWIGLIIFAYLFEIICSYIAEERKCKEIIVGFSNNKNNYDIENPTLEDVMFYSGLSDEELDEILPDYNMDLEDLD